MSAATPALLTPRLGFLGTGWIGRNRLRALRASGAATIGLLCDPDAGALSAAAAEAPDAVLAGSLQDLLSAGPDGIVIATPNALHAEQAIAALESGVAVFCQKPLGRTAGEVERILKAARKADLLLGVDLSYRHTAAAAALKRAYDSGELGTVFAAELEFHNAYGPDKAWFRDPAQAGGGCVLDLGVHLVDLALWMLDFPGVRHVACARHAGGHRIPDTQAAAEDYAEIRLDLETGAIVRIACSWDLHAGADAVIRAAFFGTRGGARLENVAGSFYDFRAELTRSTSSRLLSSPPDDWGGRALVAWALQLAAGGGYDPEADRLLALHQVLDRCCGR